MDTDNILRVKLGNKITSEFYSNIGVRQGDTLSPNLFKIFLNDLVDIFDDTCDSVSLENFELSCLMYADDVILFSTSENGLKHCLEKLQEYCGIWCLDINIDKTKISFSIKMGTCFPLNSTIMKRKLKLCRIINILVLCFPELDLLPKLESISIIELLKHILSRLKGIFENILPSIDTSLHAFDHTVKPILLYGCEVWGTSNLNSASIRNETMFKVEKSFENFQSEKLAMKFYKYILGTHKKTTNLPIMGDLGRTHNFIDIICAMIKYFKRINSLEKDSLLYKTFYTSKKVSVDSSDCWFSFVMSIFKELKLSSSLSITEIKSVLITRYMKYWEGEITKNAIDKRGKLRTYYTFKPFFKKRFLSIGN